MHQQLKERLWAYIVHNNPELMFNLQEDYKVTQYLEDKVSSVMSMALNLMGQDKPGYAITELCMAEMTKELRPSRYNYLTTILSEEFIETYERLRESGLLTYETINLIGHCNPVFEQFGFNEETQEASILRYAIIGSVAEYLESSQ